VRNEKIRIILLVVLISLTLTSCAHFIDPTEVAQKVLPATAYIILRDSNRGIMGIGSGFFIQAGTIVTCYHVVATALKVPNVKISVCINGKIDKEYEIRKIVYKNETNDIAVIATDNIAPSVLKLGNSDDIMIGQTIYVGGNPKGIPSIFTVGIISGIIDRSLDPLGQIIFSAPIAPGNSGGPLVDEDCNVIGIVEATIAGTQMTNMAIPINLLDKIVLRY